MKSWRKTKMNVLLFSMSCFSASIESATWNVVDSTGSYSGAYNQGASGNVSAETGYQLPYQGAYTSSPQGTLAYCIWNAAPGDTINIQVPSVTLTSPLPAILAGKSGSLTIQGNGVTINGNYTYPVFAAVNSGNVTISGCNIKNAKSKGGNGGTGCSGGGGGVGGGSGLYVAQGANVTISAVSFSSCQSQGGNGGTYVGSVYYLSGGGGGGFGGGDGGIAQKLTYDIGGGGGGHPGGGKGGQVSSNYIGGAASPYTTSGGGGGGTLAPNPYPGGDSTLYKGGAVSSSATAKESGGGGGMNGDGFPLTGGAGLGSESYGGGGGGAIYISSNSGGSGIGAGGGGGGYTGKGGAGGPYGGGGGGSALSSGGAGGFGGGGGGAVYTTNPPGGSLALGGTGGTSYGAGGGGAALGGAIFVQIGGVLTITGSTSSGTFGLNYNSVVAGKGGGGNASNGQALGVDIFVRSGGKIIFDPGIGASITLSNPIQSDQGQGGGTGGGVQVNSGTLNLRGPNTYTGETQIASGATLVINEGSILGYNSSNASNLNNIVNNGLLTINASYLSYNGQISGTGDLSLTGNSYLSLTSQNPYTGNTSVDINNQLSLQASSIGSSGVPSADVNISGLLYLDSDSSIYCTNFTTSSSGVVQGCGNITVSNDFNNNGTISSGCSVSSLTIDVPVINAFSGSVINPKIQSDGVATIVVSGDLNIYDDVTLKLNAKPGSYSQGSSYPVVLANSISGEFSFVEINTLLLNPKISYSNGEISLEIQRVPLSNFVNDKNKKAVAQGIECTLEREVKKRASLPLMEKIFYFSQDELSLFLDSMQPSIFKGLTISQENNAIQVGQALGYRLEDILNQKHCNSQQSDFHVWVDGFGDFLMQKNTSFEGSDQIGYDTHTGAAVVGFDAKVHSFYFGALSSYTGSTTKWNEGRGNGTIDTVYGGVYASAIGNLFYGNFSLIGGWSHFTGKRAVLLADEKFTANHTNGGAQLTSHIDTGLNFHVKGISIRPFDAFDYICQTENGYTEKGANAFDLHVAKSNAIMLRNELGLQLAKCFSIATHTISVSPKISWVREVRVKGSSYTASLLNSSCNYTVTGFFPDRSLVSPGLLVSSSLFDDFVSFDLYYNGQYGSNYNNTNYGGQLRIGF